MIALLALASLPRFTASEVAWQHTVGKLARDSKAYRQAFLGHAPTWRRVRQWLGAARVLGDDSPKHPREGLKVPYDYSGATVAGQPGAVVVLLEEVKKDGSENSDNQCLAYFHPEGKRVVGSVVTVSSGADDDDYEPPMPGGAALIGDTLALTCTVRWEGNGPAPSVQTYRHTLDGWKQTSRLVSEFQGWGGAALELTKGGKSIRPVRMGGRTYPKHMQACHACAQLTGESQWSFRNGVFKKDWTHLYDTAYNALDRLYGDLELGNEARASRLFVNRRLFQKVWSRRSRMGSEEQPVSFPGSICLPSAKVIGLYDLGFDFHFIHHSGKWVVARLTPIKEKRAM